MTGNQIKGKGFGGALNYNLEKVEQRMAEMLDHNFLGEDRKTILKEVAIIKAERPNLQKYFYHTSINFPPNENLSNDLMKEIGKEYLAMNGFTQHQYIMFRHYDANHPHLHILVNRIGNDGSVVSDSNDFARSEKVLRQLEIKYNLQQVTPSKQAQERAITKDELEMMKRTNTPSNKMQLQLLIRNILKSSQSSTKLTTNEFIEQLEAKGINVKFNQATTGYVSGISYSYEGFTTTGAKLGNNYKWNAIKTSINYEQERDRELIQHTNQKSPEIFKQIAQSQRSLNESQWKDKFNEITHKQSPDNQSIDNPFSESGEVLSDLMEARSYDQHADQQSNLLRKKKKKKRKGPRL